MGKEHSSDEVISAYEEFKGVLSQEYKTIGDLKSAIDKALGDFSSKVYSLLQSLNLNTGANGEDNFFRDLRQEGRQVPSMEDFLDIISLNHIPSFLPQNNPILKDIQNLLRKKIEEILAKNIERPLQNYQI